MHKVQLLLELPLEDRAIGENSTNPTNGDIIAWPYGDDTIPTITVTYRICLQKMYIRILYLLERF
jgi:hypothetical protein